VPDLNGERSPNMGTSRRERLNRLLVRLELREDLSAEQSKRLEAQFAEDEKRGYDFGRSRFLAPTTGIPPTRTIASLSDVERRLACAWQSQLWRHSGFGLECTLDGWKGTKLDYSQCVERRASCDATIGEIEECERAIRFGNGCFTSPPLPKCRALRSCLFGFASASSSSEGRLQTSTCDDTVLTWSAAP
jgi:hypothetical protein